MSDQELPARRPDQRPRGNAAALRVARDALTVRRAFGEPIRHGDLTLVPVARVGGGAGSGYGSGEMGAGTSAAEATGEGSGSGGGGGFGVRVKPLGVYAVQGSQVSWRPALDVNRVTLGGQVLAAVAVVAIACSLRRRRS